MIGAVAVVASLAAEALALYTANEWMVAGAADNKHAVSAAALVVLSLAAFGIPRVAANLELAQGPLRAATAAVTFALIYGALRLSFAHDLALWDLDWVVEAVRNTSESAREGATAMAGALIVVAIWARSSFRSARDIDLDLLPRETSWAFAAVTAIVILGALTSRSSEVARGGAAFYAVAILALATSQLQRSGTTMGEVRSGGITAALLGGTLAVTVGCVVLFGIVFGVLAEPIGSALGRAVELVLTIILTPIAWAMQAIIGALLGDVNLQLPVQEAVREAGEPGRQEPSRFTRVAGYGLRGLGLVALVAVAALVIAAVTSLRRRIRLSPAGVLDSGERGYAAGEGGWRGWFRRGGSRRGVGAGRGIFRLYGEVLHDAEERGRARRPAETPAEFEPQLSETFHTPVTGEITAAFEEAAYGGREPSPSQVEALERRWRTETLDRRPQ